jgi:hypothetical protein
MCCVPLLPHIEPFRDRLSRDRILLPECDKVGYARLSSVGQMAEVDPQLAIEIETADAWLVKHHRLRSLTLRVEPPDATGDISLPRS